MEAAADVLLGMAAEKIQALVIHLCTIAHTHAYTQTHMPSVFLFSLSLSFSDMQKCTQSCSSINTLLPSFLPSFLLHRSLAICNSYSILLSTAFIYFTLHSTVLTVKAATALLQIAQMLWWKETQTCNYSYCSHITTHIRNDISIVLVLLQQCVHYNSLEDVLYYVRSVLREAYLCFKVSHTALWVVWLCRHQTRLIYWSCVLTEATHCSYQLPVFFGSRGG